MKMNPMKVVGPTGLALCFRLFFGGRAGTHTQTNKPSGECWTTMCVEMRPFQAKHEIF